MKYRVMGGATVNVSQPADVDSKVGPGGAGWTSPAVDQQARRRA